MISSLPDLAELIIVFECYAQLYLGFPDAGEPPKVLRGFERVPIKAGQSAKVAIKLRVIDVSIW